MRGLITAMLFAFSVQSAVAQQSNELLMRMLTTCLPTEHVEQKLFEEFEEIPFAQSQGFIERYDREMAPGLLKIYINPDNFTVSVLIEFENDQISCVMFMGNNFTPIVQGDET